MTSGAACAHSSTAYTKNVIQYMTKHNLTPYNISCGAPVRAAQRPAQKILFNT